MRCEDDDEFASLRPELRRVTSDRSEWESKPPPRPLAPRKTQSQPHAARDASLDSRT